MAEDWIDAERNRLREEYQATLASKGKKPFVQIVKGENVLEIDRKTPARKEGSEYGPRYIFELLDPADKELSCSPALYRMVINQLAKQDSGVLRILRMGDGPKTRYDFA